MKTSIVPEIILGVFGTPYFSEYRDANNWKDYGFEELSRGATSYNDDGVLGIVFMAAKRTSKINFFLDELNVPLSKKSITCTELQMLIKEDLVDKIQFWLEGQKIETKLIMKIIKSKKKGNFSTHIQRKLKKHERFKNLLAKN